MWAYEQFHFSPKISKIKFLTKVFECLECVPYRENHKATLRQKKNKA